MPSADDVANVYGDAYWTRQDGDAGADPSATPRAAAHCGYDDYFGNERAASDAKAAHRMDVLAQLGVTPPCAILDVGCADARFLLEANRRGHRVTGVEWSSVARSNVDPELAPHVFARLEDPGVARRGPFEVVTLFDVLEHLPDPAATLRTARAIAAPGATWMIVVPVIDNVNARFFPHRWDQYKPPEHLWFFSRRALRSLLSNELGLTVVHESCAWRRDARLVDVTPAGSRGDAGFSTVAQSRRAPRTAGRGSAGVRVSAIARRAMRRLDVAFWTTLERAHVLDAVHFEDSVLFVARAGVRT